MPPAFAIHLGRTSTETPWIGVAAKDVVQPVNSFARALMLSEALLYRLSQAFPSWLGLVLEFAAGHSEVIAKCGERLRHFVEERGRCRISVSQRFSPVRVRFVTHNIANFGAMGEAQRINYHNDPSDGRQGPTPPQT
jgi:hypothetical protein